MKLVSIREEEPSRLLKRIIDLLCLVNKLTPPEAKLQAHLINFDLPSNDDHISDGILMLEMYYILYKWARMPVDWKFWTD